MSIATSTLTSWPDELIRQFVAHAVQKPDGEGAPETILGKSYPVPHVLATDGLTDLLAADALQLDPFFAWIGEPSGDSTILRR
jgi:hypothetical protein